LLTNFSKRSFAHRVDDLFMFFNDRGGHGGGETVTFFDRLLEFCVVIVLFANRFLKNRRIRRNAAQSVFVN
jgi:hypothetical protein